MRTNLPQASSGERSPRTGYNTPIPGNQPAISPADILYQMQQMSLQAEQQHNTNLNHQYRHVKNQLNEKVNFDAHVQAYQQSIAALDNTVNEAQASANQARQIATIAGDLSQKNAREHALLSQEAQVVRENCNRVSGDCLNLSQRTQIVEQANTQCNLELQRAKSIFNSHTHFFHPIHEEEDTYANRGGLYVNPVDILAAVEITVL